MKWTVRPQKYKRLCLKTMAEGTITVGGQTHPSRFVHGETATQNPVEQEGTYPLPEAQMDRFIMKVTVDYPEDEAGVTSIPIGAQWRAGQRDEFKLVTPQHIEPELVLEKSASPTSWYCGFWFSRKLHCGFGYGDS